MLSNEGLSELPNDSLSDLKMQMKEELDRSGEYAMSTNQIQNSENGIDNDDEIICKPEKAKNREFQEML